MAQRRWIRLDVGWDTSDWIVGLSPPAQLAWVRLLAWVKSQGTGGTVKAMTARAAGAVWRIPEADVAALLEAAATDGALEIADGEWRVTGWVKYQDPDRTSTVRKRRERDRKRHGGHGVTSVTGGVTRRATETETETETLTDSPTHQPRTQARGVAELVAFLGPHGEAVERMASSAEHGSTWPRALLGLYGPDGTDPQAWGSVPPNDRPPLLAKAMDRLAGEGRAYNGRLFRAILRKVIDERSEGANGGRAPDREVPGKAPAGGGGKAGGGSGPDQSNRRRRGFGEANAA